MAFNNGLNTSMRDFCSQLNMYQCENPTPEVLSDLKKRSVEIQNVMRSGSDAVIAALDARQVTNFKGAVIQLDRLEERVKQVSQQIAPPRYFQPEFPTALMQTNLCPVTYTPLTYTVEEQRVEELQKISSGITELEKTLVKLEEDLKNDQTKEGTEEFIVRLTQAGELVGEIKVQINAYIQDQETIDMWNKELKDCENLIKNITEMLFV